MATRAASWWAVRCRSATQFNPEKLENAPSNNSSRPSFDKLLCRQNPELDRRLRIFALHALPSASRSFVPTHRRQQRKHHVCARKSASSPVPQLSSRM